MNNTILRKLCYSSHYFKTFFERMELSKVKKTNLTRRINNIFNKKNLRKMLFIENQSFELKFHFQLIYVIQFSLCSSSKNKRINQNQSFITKH